MRIFTVTVICLLLATEACALGFAREAAARSAEGQINTPIAGHSCATIKFLVKVFGPKRALAWAEKEGYSKEDINAARRCLRS